MQIELSELDRYKSRVLSIHMYIQSHENIKRTFNKLLEMFQEKNLEISERIKILNECEIFSKGQQSIKKINSLIAIYEFNDSFLFKNLPQI